MTPSSQNYSGICHPVANFCHSAANFRVQYEKNTSHEATGVSFQILSKYLRDKNQFEYYSALKLLNAVQDAMCIADLDLSAEPAMLKIFAQHKANLCKHHLINHPADIQFAIQQFQKYGLGSLDYNDTELANRLSDSRFWFRRIRRKTIEIIGQIERAINHVSKRKAIYCGDTSFANFKHSQQLSEQYMKRTHLENEDGLSISLHEIAEHNISNPAIRRAELMVRIRGFEEVAQQCGHAAIFTTITTPSRMHATHSTGLPNAKYDGSSVADAQAYLNHVWQLIRAKLDRSDIKPYGFRVVEPHHDGTPHWHLLLFMPNEQINTFKNITTDYALLDSPDEKGAQDYRINYVDIDPAKGSAAGYIAKYVAKNIDGFALDTDRYGVQAIDAAQRTSAWARANNIRQFQQIGGPSVTVWRELRRLKGCETPFNDLNESYQAADSANWAAFCFAMNAVNTKRSEHRIAPYYAIKESEVIDYLSGEINSTSLNKYGEQRKASITGLRFMDCSFSTRLKKWRILKEPPSRDAIPPFGGVALSEVEFLDLCK
ncbi:replication endonuclease [Rheinheimera salexigens]|uniref:Replication gene A protein-like domain-containing protein n=1 Tax=Rheinheimera salexigens TaxID=1628148 RepID=A0A1E7Q985_9GAMM|nr:replication endonuclease [Rheinheimera salexigens]OEY70690.1 hypothetical protein BI198_14800 [Rheinheimera salexigens]